MFDGSYHLFMVIWGMVYYCFNHFININVIDQTSVGDIPVCKPTNLRLLRAADKLFRPIHWFIEVLVEHRSSVPSHGGPIRWVRHLPTPWVHLELPQNASVSETFEGVPLVQWKYVKKLLHGAQTILGKQASLATNLWPMDMGSSRPCFPCQAFAIYICIYIPQN